MGCKKIKSFTIRKDLNYFVIKWIACSAGLHATRSFIMILKSLYFCPRFWGNLVLPDFARYNQHKISALTSNKSTQFSWLQSYFSESKNGHLVSYGFVMNKATCRSVCLSSVYDLQGDVSIFSEMGIIKDYVDTLKFMERLLIWPLKV